MADCGTLNGVLLGCDAKTAGGVSFVYIGLIPSGATGSDMSEYLTFNALTDTIVAFTGTSTATGDLAVDLYKYEFEKNSASLTYETVSPETIGFKQTVVLAIPKIDEVKRKEILLLAKTNKIMIAVASRDGSYLVAGANEGMVMSAFNATTGAALGDKNQYTLTFEGYELEQPFFANASAVTDAVEPTV